MNNITEVIVLLAFLFSAFIFGATLIESLIYVIDEMRGKTSKNEENDYDKESIAGK